MMLLRNGRRDRKELLIEGGDVCKDGFAIMTPCERKEHKFVRRRIR